MLRVQNPWFTEILNQRKTVEGRIGVQGERDNLLNLDVVDVILATNPSRSIQIKVTSIQHYPNLESYLVGEGWERCAPHASSLQDAIEKYLSVSTQDGVYPFNPDIVALNGGINAIRFVLVNI